MRIRPLYTTPITLLFLIACGKNSLNWTEEVRLPSGAALQLKRSAEFEGPHAMGDTATESMQRLEFKNPFNGERVVWENFQEQGALNTIALWLNQGRPRLLTSPAYSNDLYKFDCPNPPYLLYEYQDGRWTSVPLTSIGRDIVRANMTTYVKQMQNKIKGNRFHVPVEETSNSYAYKDGVERVPHLIKFQDMPAQTFNHLNCSSKSNYLLVKQEDFN